MCRLALSGDVGVFVCAVGADADRDDVPPEDAVVVEPGGEAAVFADGDFFQADAAGKGGFAEAGVAVFRFCLPCARGIGEGVRGVGSEAVVPWLAARR